MDLAQADGSHKLHPHPSSSRQIRQSSARFGMTRSVLGESDRMQPVLCGLHCTP